MAKEDSWTHGEKTMRGSIGRGIVFTLTTHIDEDGKHRPHDDRAPMRNEIPSAVISISVWTKFDDPEGLAEHLAKEAQEFIDA